MVSYATTQGSTRYGDISPRTTARAERKFLRNVGPQIVFGMFGQTRPQPKNATQAVKFRRWKPFRPSAIPLVEGVTPNASQMGVEDVTATLKEYGNYTEISDFVADTHEDDVFEGAGQEMAKWAQGSQELIIFNAVKGGTNVAYANGTARTDVNTAITLAKVRGAVRALQAQKADKITKIVAPGPDYNTTPVEAAYVAIGHTDLANDIRNLAGFVPVAKYSQMKPISQYEIGSVEDVRFILTADVAPWADGGGDKGSMVSTTGTKADVYPLIIIGQDSYAQVPLKGANSMAPIVLQPQPRGGDPLGQRGTVGVKFTTTAVILQELWQIRLEVAATAL